MECQFCHATDDLHSVLDELAEYDEQQEFYVCNSCWGAICTVVIRMMSIQFPELVPVVKRDG